MTIHLIFFIIDVLSWIAASAFIAIEFYPDKRVKKLSRKIDFIVPAVTTAICAGLFATLDRGLPDLGFGVYEFILASLSAIAILSIRNRKFRINVMMYVNQQVTIILHQSNITLKVPNIK